MHTRPQEDTMVNVNDNDIINAVDSKESEFIDCPLYTLENVYLYVSFCAQIQCSVDQDFFPQHDQNFK